MAARFLALSRTQWQVISRPVALQQASIRCIASTPRRLAELAEPAPGAAPSAKVAQLADEILKLNLLEVGQLNDVLKNKLGMKDIPLMMGGGAPAAPAAAAPAAAKPAEVAPPKEEKTVFTLKLKKYEDSKKIGVIKEVRAIMELGLKEAKALVEGVSAGPAIIKENLKKEEAAPLLEKLKAAGADVVLE
eukprot:TRINITY_DN1682_c0_g1::TRINITY_DN1682_c0_g1_i1::g.17780::m.17780 TRINITY_DN1682_c0_g1::TRINITY_DN1682_c0_g1_i1::g.17780  ORF type:complete len:205 (+),score=76.93,sp/B3EER1/RL7_CHLL2/42.65/2e-15,Ribosomal_L12/PF00542.14/2.1e-19,DUF3235/PF11574.3/2,DUF3235/PF11574.3/34 TRINITY_DN1682_c0_g1_i1:46-615(+)